MSYAARVAVLSLALLPLCGCPKDDGLQPFKPSAEEPDYGRPLGPGEVALRKIGPEEYPDFSRGFDKRPDLIEAARNSLAYLNKPSSRKYFPYLDVTHDRARASVEEFIRVLQEAQSPQQLDALVRERFEVYKSVGWDRKGTVFFTGYYCPIFEGRRQGSAVFKYPLYAMPPDLVKDSEGNTLGRRMPDGSLQPYFTRRQIDQEAPLRGLEIAWLKDPFEAYVVTVQGSAKLRLEDGTFWELGYAANNGHDYVPIAKQMIEDKVISRNELSLQTLIRYFKQHPNDIYKYVWNNPRYVFFKESPGGPYGSLNVPVLPYRSLATDKQVYPRACVAFADTRVPRIEADRVSQQPFASFILDQDTGGAIRAAGRADIFLGTGPAAEAIAGRTGSEGALYYIFVKPGGAVAMRRN